ncbi:MAG TPA: hypothetical protein VK666_20445 [Chryseolinea sp.]|nr:hypothetical protein [Chryseolinea sp.]
MISLKITFIYFFCFLCTTALAQSNFLPGYYITLDQDTVHGFIDYRSETRNYSVCFFKSDLASEATALRPTQINGFVVNDVVIYEKHIHKSRKGEELYGFFKVLVSGKVNLLQYWSEYYITDSAGKIYDLSEKELGSGGIRRKDYYKVGIMKVVLKDCEELSGRMEERYRSNSDLEDIVQEYHECLGLKFYRTKRIKIPVAFKVGVSASVVSNRMSFKAGGFENAVFNNKILPEVGPYVSIFIPRIGDKMRVITEVLYGQNNTYSFFANKTFNNDFFAKYSYLRIPVYFRYSPSAFFLEYGLQAQVILSQELRWRRESVLTGIVNTEEMEPPDLPVPSFGFIAGGGVRLYAGNVCIQPTLRFSATYSTKEYAPQFQRLEFNLKLGLR